MKTTARVVAAIGLFAALFILPQAHGQSRDVPYRLQGEVKDIDHSRSTVTIKGEDSVVTVFCTPDSNLVTKEKGAGSELRDFDKGSKVMVTFAKDPTGRLVCLELAEKGTKVYRQEKQETR